MMREKEESDQSWRLRELISTKDKERGSVQVSFAVVRTKGGGAELASGPEGAGL